MIIKATKKTESGQYLYFGIPRIVVIDGIMFDSVDGYMSKIGENVYDLDTPVDVEIDKDFWEDCVISALVLNGWSRAEIKMMNGDYPPVDSPYFKKIKYSGETEETI